MRPNRVGRAEIPLVEPAIGLLRENPSHAVAIKIDPLVLRSVETIRQVLTTRAGNLKDWLRGELFRRWHLTVCKLERRQRLLAIPGRLGRSRLAPIARLHDLGEEGGHGALGVVKLGGTHQAVVNTQLCSEVMKHQDTLATTIGAHLEARTIVGERVLPHRPWRTGRWRQLGDDVYLSVCVGSQGLIMPFAVIKDGLEHPSSVGKQRGVGGVPCGIPIRRAVAVLNALDVTIGSARPVPFVGLGAINALLVLLGVRVDDGVALVVITVADQPGKDVLRVVGVADAACGALPV